MAYIVPTITAETPEAYLAAVEMLNGFATRVHIDISDGEFAPTLLMAADQLSWPGEWQVDVHAMVVRPSEHLQKLIALKPLTIIIHAEVSENVAVHLRTIKQAGIRAGVALLRTTVPSSVADAIKEADHVMIFSGDLGKQGGKASMMQVEKIRLVKLINPNVEIGWDGGVTIDNAYTITQAGVDIVNAGSAISKAEKPAEAFQALTTEINKHGVI
jgi:ribulose-phosphate 3-epimerase